MKNLEVIVLAAGKGTRLNKGKSSPTAKVLYQIGDKPIIFYLIETLSKLDIKPLLVVGYKADEVKKIVGNKAEYVIQEKQLGTADAVNSAKQKLLDSSCSIMVLCGDMPLLSAKTLKELINIFQKEKPTIAVLTVEFDDPNKHCFGRILRDEKGNIASIVEQKNATEEEKQIKESNSGVYVFDSKWLWQNIDKIKKDPISKEYYLTDLVEMAIKQNKKVIGIKSQNQKEFLGINTLEQLQRIEEII